MSFAMKILELENIYLCKHLLQFKNGVLWKIIFWKNTINDLVMYTERSKKQK